MNKIQSGLMVRLIFGGTLIFLLGFEYGLCDLNESVMHDPNSPFNYSTFGEASRAVVGRVFGIQDQGGEIRYYAFNMTEPTRSNAGFRSLLIPGWGQAFNQQRVKGTLIFLSATAAGVGSYFLYRESRDSFDDYEAKGSRDDNLYDDYERERIQSIILGSVAGFLWIYSIFDASRHAYNPLWSRQENPLEFAVNPHGGEIFYRRRFK